MSYLEIKQQKANPFTERKQLFYNLIKKQCVVKRSNLIEMMGVSVDKFMREYKLYVEALAGAVLYDEKSQRFLFDVNDVVIDYDYCTGRPERKQEYTDEVSKTIRDVADRIIPKGDCYQ